MDGAAPPPLTFAIIGGGFSGACLALHLARARFPGRIMIIETRAQVGLGVAYSTRDPAHRINARASRMSLYPDDPAHFSRWLAETGACDDDPEAALPDGRLFPRRAVYGAYVGGEVAALVAAGRVTHVRDEAVELAPRGLGWRIRGATGAWLEADMVALATGHPPPQLPGALAEIVGHRAFIASPARPGVMEAIAPDAEVLIIGTGLTMADAVATLDQAGHAGPITAVSRRGQAPRPHAMEDRHCEVSFAPPATGAALVRAARAAVAAARAQGLPWQSVFDGLRWRAEELWGALPDVERRRLLRHARPFWETHRHRLPPPTAAVLARRASAGTLRFMAASVTMARGAGERIELLLRPRGASAAAWQRYDAVILTAGAGRPDQPPDGLCARLARAGLLSLDATGLGFRCCGGERRLYAVGPPTRGAYGEIISVPEIARQAAGLAAAIVNDAVAILTNRNHIGFNLLSLDAAPRNGLDCRGGRE